MKKRGPLKDAVVMFIILGIITACVGAADIPSASELINKYTQALDSTSSFIADYEKTTEGSFRSGRVSSARKSFSRGQLRYDNQRLYEYEYRWGNLGPGPMTFTEDKPHYNIAVVNREMNYQNTKRVGDRHRPGKVIRRPRPQGQNITLHAHFGVSYLAGYFGSDERLDAILRKADRIWVQEKPQKVGDSDCFVIEADTKCGRYKVWLDPEHGFHPAKLLHEAGEGDYSDRHLMAKGDSAKEYLKNVRFEKVGDVWVPMEADSGSDLRSAQGDFVKDNYHYKRTKIVLNPDHNKLGSFDDPLENPSNDPELTNGTRVLKNYLPMQYTWQDGKVVDALGQVILDSGPAPKQPAAPADAKEVLRRFTESRKNLNSFIVKGSSTRSSTTTRSGKGVQYWAFEARFDGNRVKNITSLWGDIGIRDRDIKEKDAHYYMNLWDGETAYSFTKSNNHNKGIGQLRMSDKGNPGDYSKRAPESFKGSSFGIVMGYHYGDKVPIGELFLGSSVKLQLRDKRSNLRGVDCYVLEADVPKYGKYTVWIDPVHDFHIARIRVQRGPGDRMGSESNLLILKEGAIRKDSYEVLEFEKKGGAWFPKICKWKKYYTFPGYKSIDEKDLTFSTITLNPDHDALGSFLPDDIPNGCDVRLLSLPPSKKFVWQNGKVVDKDGREVDVDKLIKAESEKVKKPKPKRK